MTFITSFSQRPSFTLAFTLHLVIAEETLVDQFVEVSSPDHASNPNSPRVQISPPEAEIPASPRTQSSPSRVESPIPSGTNSPSLQPEAPNPSRILPTSPQLEASVLQGTPQAPPQLITQEIPLEPEQNFPPIQESRNEVSVNTYTFISIQ
jgi:hypothetical protein